MTVSNQSHKIGPTTGVGSVATYNYPYRVDADSHLKVVTTVISTGVETTLTQGVDYTLSGGTAPYLSGVDVTLTAGNLPATKTITIYRDTPLSQEVDLGAQEDLPEESVELGIDKPVLMLQEMQGGLDRTLQVPVSTNLSTVSTVIPVPSAGKALIGKSDNTGWENSTNDFDTIVADATTQATAAASSASAAAASATSAATAQTNAETAETNAETAQTAAEAAQAAAEAAAGSVNLPSQTGAARKVLSANSTETGYTYVNTGLMPRLTKASNYTVVDADKGSLIFCSAAITVAIDPVANLYDGFWFAVRNNSGGSVTINPNGSELIDGLPTLTLVHTETVIVQCDGSNFRTIGYSPSATESIRGVATLATQAEAEAGTNDTDMMTPLKVSQAIAALGGGWVDVSSAEASASTSLLFSSTFGAGYEWRLYSDDLKMTSDAVNLTAQVQVSGTTRSTAGDYAWNVRNVASGSSAASGSNSATAMQINRNAIDLNAASAIDLEIRLTNPEGTTNHKRFKWDIAYRESTATEEVTWGGGVFKGATSAIDGIELKSSSGTIASGTITLQRRVKPNA